ncbi:MerC mercury resistance protein [Idiomarina fontislapidosi]|uniref:MerC domain-containing protein n=1 Tax=Idiomarina fontislapidosi TaxID=263723 RepID=A0A432Y809_9GAMM|nr:MerC domain-containing protein [Idiomarina fontislapidosi]PYE32412.1 MerC mercury resistance protein [Idiomarina fontislapidosi]RUO57115.1 MerC domain-containing protein [Idiomarina fontislapidosi]|tara:strand:+ start:1113 stop:1523 length:411 start_codon:yes stop_codon:yes gene_type:complete
MTYLKQRKLDRAGIWITTICAIHCLLLPLILPLLALIGFSFLGEDLLENAILGISVVVGLAALIGGAKQHGKWSLLLPLVAGAFIYSQRDLLGPWGEPVIIALGAGLIIYAHISNLRRSRKLSASTATPLAEAENI